MRFDGGAASAYRENDTRGFTARLESGADFALFIVRRDGAFHAYENWCPHAGTPLDWAPDRFMDFTETRLQCSTHGAQFEIETGLCVSGPCFGERLRALPVAVENGRLVVTLPRAASP
jgi:nitrite reductase/ring-hydroxylating ferredoxin subunit